MRFYIFTCLVGVLALGVNMNNGVAQVLRGVQKATTVFERTKTIMRANPGHTQKIGDAILNSPAASAILHTARNAAGLSNLVTQYESATGQARLDSFVAVLNGLESSQNPSVVDGVGTFAETLNVLNTRIENSQSFTPELIERAITEELSRPELFNRISQSIDVNRMPVTDVAVPSVTNTVTTTGVVPVERLSEKMKRGFTTAIEALRRALLNRATETGDAQMARLIPAAISRVNGLLENNLMIPGPKASECVAQWDFTKNPAVNNLLRLFLAVTPDTLTYTSAKNQILAKMEQLFNSSGLQVEQQNANNVLTAIQRLHTLTSTKCGTLNAPLATA